MKLDTVFYFFSEGAANVRRNTSLISLCTVAVSLFILGLVSLLMVNLRYVAQDLGSRVEIRVFLKEDLKDAERSSLRWRIASLEGVESITFVSKEEALQRLRRQLGERQGLLDVLDENPLPDSFDLRVKKPELVAELAASIRKLPGVDEVTTGGDFVERLIALGRLLWAASLILMGIFLLASILIIGNAVRLSLFARRREIEIMKLVGATDWFIRWPFIIEGMIIGTIGAVISGTLLYFLYRFAVDKAIARAPFIPVMTDSTVTLWLCVGLVVAGLFIGGIASGLFVRRYLKV